MRNQQLRRIKIEEVPSDKNRHYVYNESEGFAIKVPDKVSKLIEKIDKCDNPYLKTFLYDLLAMAIQYKRLSNSNAPVRKLLTTFSRSKLVPGLFSEEETKALIEFIRECPKDYDFKPLLIFTNIEFGEKILS